MWTLAKEKILTDATPITFLGIDMSLMKNGDVNLNQRAFAQQLLDKHGMGDANPTKCIQMSSLPTELDLPTPKELKQLQGYSGEFNWLATRTRTDLSYYVSVLASACTRFAKWSFELAKKILRYLRATLDVGLVISRTGEEQQLHVWTDAGYAGSDTRSQSGLVVVWAGSVISL